MRPATKEANNCEFLIRAPERLIGQFKALAIQTRLSAAWHIREAMQAYLRRSAAKGSK
jgi:predicted transcriptional regulator